MEYINCKYRPHLKDNHRKPMLALLTIESSSFHFSVTNQDNMTRKERINRLYEGRNSPCDIVLEARRELSPKHRVEYAGKQCCTFFRPAMHVVLLPLPV